MQPSQKLYRRYGTVKSVHGEWSCPSIVHTQKNKQTLIVPLSHSGIREPLSQTLVNNVCTAAVFIHTSATVDTRPVLWRKHPAACVTVSLSFVCGWNIYTPNKIHTTFVSTDCTTMLLYKTVLHYSNRAAALWYNHKWKDRGQQQITTQLWHIH